MPMTLVPDPEPAPNEKATQAYQTAPYASGAVCERQ